MSIEMKDSHHEIIGKIPEDWHVTTLGNIAQIYNGKSIKDYEKDNYLVRNSETVPYISTKDISATTNDIDYYSDMFTNINDDYFRIAPEGSVLLCIEGGSAGKKNAFTNQDVSFVNKLACIDAKKGFNSKFIYYVINSGAFYQLFLSRVTGLIPGVNITELKKFPVAIGSTVEQNKIVEFLDKRVKHIHEIINFSKRSIEELNSYKQSLITETVTKGLHPEVPMKDSGIVWFGNIPEDWIVTKISRLFEIKAGGDAKPEYYNGEKNDIYKYPVYTNSSDKNEVYAYTSKPIFNKNSITVTGRGEIGIAFYRDVKFDAIIRLLVLTPKFDLDMRYFAYFINNVLEFSTGSSAVGQLSTIQISPYPILLPSKKEQKQIADYLDEKTAQINQLIEDKNKLIEELENYKQSLIYEYVTGKKEV